MRCVLTVCRHHSNAPVPHVSQGTHVTAHLGTYILQWRYHESTGGHHSSPLELIDSITAHKARVMYFYETLRSADYK